MFIYHMNPEISEFFTQRKGGRSQFPLKNFQVITLNNLCMSKLVFISNDRDILFLMCIWFWLPSSTRIRLLHIFRSSTIWSFTIEPRWSTSRSENSFWEYVQIKKKFNVFRRLNKSLFNHFVVVLTFIVSPTLRAKNTNFADFHRIHS